MEHSGALDEIGSCKVYPYVLDGVLDYMAVSPQTADAVKAHLSDNTRALLAEAAELLEQATEEE